MEVWEFIDKKKLIFVLERATEKVTLRLKLLPLDHERFIRSLAKVNFDVIQMKAEGWNIISSKYHISPVIFSGMWSEKYALFVDKDYVIITETPSELIKFGDYVSSTSITDLIMNPHIEVAAVISPCADEYDIKGDLNDEEISLLNKIVHTSDTLSELIGEMLSLLSGMIWYPQKGWLIVGEEHSLISFYGKWIIINTEKLKKILTEGEHPSV